jgi:Putative peptidoglycan binding domain
VGEEVFAMRRIYVVRAGIVAMVSILLATAPVGMSFGQSSKPSKGTTAAKPAHVRELQEALAKSGYDPGPVDGIMGPRTKDALRKYMAVPPPKEPSPSDQVIARFRTERREAP